MDEPDRLSEIVGVKTACCLILSSMGFFHLLSLFIRHFGIPSKVAEKNSTDEVWKWRNLSLSMCHSCIVGTWDLTCFYFYPNIQQDLIAHIRPYTYYLLLFSTAYFLYDFGDVIINGKFFKMWELSLHHIAVVSTFLINALSQNFVGYTVVALLTEVNSIFLHFRKLLQMCGQPFTGRLYRINAVVNAVTFLLFRGYALIVITVGMYMERARIDRVYLVILSIAMIIMDILNPFLFAILVKNDFWPRRRRGLPEKPVSNGHGHVATVANGSEYKLAAAADRSNNNNSI